MDDGGVTIVDEHYPLGRDIHVDPDTRVLNTGPFNEDVFSGAPHQHTAVRPHFVPAKDEEAVAGCAKGRVRRPSRACKREGKRGKRRGGRGEYGNKESGGSVMGDKECN